MLCRTCDIFVERALDHNKAQLNLENVLEVVVGAAVTSVQRVVSAAEAGCYICQASAYGGSTSFQETGYIDGVAPSGGENPKTRGSGSHALPGILRSSLDSISKPTPAEHIPTVDEGDASGSNEDDAKEEAIPVDRPDRILHFWRDGFSIDDGDLFCNEDPMTIQMLKFITQGQGSGKFPFSLLNIGSGDEIRVQVMQHKGEYIHPIGNRKPIHAVRRQINVGLENDGRIHMFTTYENLKNEGWTVFFGHSDIGLDVVDDQPIHEKSKTTGDSKTLALAKNWLLGCVESHSHCIQTEPGYCPSRLVDIRPCGIERSFVVVDAASLQQCPRYLTLSHRWSAETPRLSSKTASKLRTPSPWTEISGTYQDAFAVVEALGYRYIWIDSLCISQDDRQDMLSEALAMMQVYSNTTCNISALEGRTDLMFATTRSSVRYTRSRCSATNPATDRYVRLTNGSHWQSEVDDAPLNQRGWVLQEQLLADRTLYFGKAEVLWDCPTGRRCESYPEIEAVFAETDKVNTPTEWRLRARPVLRSPNDDVRLLMRQIKAARTSEMAGPGEDGQAQEAIWQFWTSVISLYAQRTISFPQDRLLGIAGIATLLAKYTHLTWAAGLWKEHMPLCLLWKALDPGPPHDTYYCPTWSWAAINDCSELAYPQLPGNLQVVAQVTGLECPTVGDNPFGNLTSAARLRLRAPSAAITSGRDGQDLRLLLRNEAIKPDFTYFDRPEYPRSGMDVSASTVESFDYETRQLHPSFVAVVIATAAEQKANGWVEIALAGLVLERVSSLENGLSSPVRWKRAGMFYLSQWRTRPTPLCHGIRKYSM